MSTLSLDDLGPKMRRKLGLETPCNCACTRTNFLPSIPVVEIIRSDPTGQRTRALPGAAWLRTGLHRLRVPPSEVQRRPASAA